MIPVVGRVEEYRRAKRVLNLGKHPAYVGPDTVRRHARNGGLIFFVGDEGADLAVAIVNPRLSCLLALNVAPPHRGHGLGGAIVDFLKVNFVRAIEDKVGFFERRGYERVGALKRGRSKSTQVMVRSDVRRLAGRLRRFLGA